MKVNNQLPVITSFFSEDGKYRYWLKVELDPNLEPSLCAFMLNPSVAGSISPNGQVRSDNTVTRMYRRAQRKGYGRLYVLNLFALVSTDPKALYDSADPVGPDNDRYIDQILSKNPAIVVAWGRHGRFLERDSACHKQIYAHHITPHCLGLTEEDFPFHPSRRAYSIPFQPYRGRFAQPSDELVMPQP